MHKITIMLTKENDKNLTKIADKLALSKSAALRLLITNIVKNNIKLKAKTKEKKEVRFTFVSAKNFVYLKKLKQKNSDLNITNLLNSVIERSHNFSFF